MKFTIPAYNKKSFKETVVKTCKRHGIKDYTMTSTPVKVIYSYDRNKAVGMKPNMIDVLGYDFEVTIPEIEKFESHGVLYLGCIKDDDLVTVHPTEDCKINLSEMKDEIAEFPCHKCGKKITRNIIHVFEDTATKEVNVYGSTCANVKFGINVNGLLSKFERIITDFSEFDIEVRGEREFSSREFIDSKTWCALAHNVICEYGYVSVTKASENGLESTKYSIWNEFNALMDENHSGSIKSPLSHEFEAKTEKYKFNWEDFIKWTFDYACTILDATDFHFNMHRAIECVKDGYVHPKVSGFVAYLMFLHWKDNFGAKEETTKKGEKVEYNTDYGHLPVGTKVKNLRVKIINNYTFESRYGTCNIYTMIGLDDNIKYKWFSSKGLDVECDHLITSGTVKELEDHAKYGKAVVITRCRSKAIE